VEPARVPASGSPARHRCGSSLVLASLEIGKALAARRRVTFRALGTCMYPCVQAGDLLHIEPKVAEQVMIDDIAVCRRPGYLFAHRTIQKGLKEGRPFIVTRSDRATDGDDGPTYDQDLLGVVTAIERNGRHVSRARRAYSWPMRFSLAGRLALLERSQSVREWLIESLACIQRTAAYRSAARLWLAATRTDVSYAVRVPLQPGTLQGLYRRLPLGEFDAAAARWRGRPLDSWTLTAHLGGRRQPAAWATFVSGPPEGESTGWRAADVQVRARYRGLGLETALLSRAEGLLARRDLPQQGSSA